MAGKNVQTIQAEHKAFNDRDWATIHGLIADSCVFVDGTGVAHKGPDAFADNYAKPWAERSRMPKSPRPSTTTRATPLWRSSWARARTTVPSGRCPQRTDPMSLPFCEIYHFGPDGKVIGGALVFRQLLDARAARARAAPRLRGAKPASTREYTARASLVGRFTQASTGYSRFTCSC